MDISKKKIDVWLIPNEHDQYTDPRRRGKSPCRGYHKTITNDERGCQVLVTWMQHYGVSCAHVCMEATSNYHERIAEYLRENGHWVSVITPTLSHAFARAMGEDQKTDKVDARTLAEFCRARRPEAWVPLTHAERHLRDLSRRRTVLVEEIRRERNRQETTVTTECRRSIARMLKRLEAEKQTIERHIAEHVQKQPEIARQVALLQSQKGVGLITAVIIIAELCNIARFDRVQQFVSFVGLAPRKRQSGSSIDTNGGISKRGNAHVRAALFMAALTAKRCDPELKAFALRLHQRGKAKMVVVVAVMRKLLHILYGIATSGQPRRIGGQAVINNIT